MVDESELPIPATMAKIDQRRGGEGSTQERIASKEILKAEPTEPGDPPPGMEAPSEESLTCAEAGLGWGTGHQGSQVGRVHSFTALGRQEPGVRH